MSIADLPLATILAETATLYETVAAMPPVVERIGSGRTNGKPGSQPPPGAADLLDADEHQRAVGKVDEDALFWAHVLLDELDGLGSVPHSTPGRLRLAERWAEHLEHHPDYGLRASVREDAETNLVALRRLSRRGVRVVRTGSPCLDVTCRGSFDATIAGPEVDGDLVCNGCGMRVPREQWQRWGSRAEWVTAARVANWLGIPVATVRVWAHRYRWDRQGTGRDVRYNAEDVKATAEGKAVPFEQEVVG